MYSSSFESDHTGTSASSYKSARAKKRENFIAFRQLLCDTKKNELDLSLFVQSLNSTRFIFQKTRPQLHENEFEKLEFEIVLN